MTFLAQERESADSTSETVWDICWNEWNFVRLRTEINCDWKEKEESQSYLKIKGVLNWAQLVCKYTKEFLHIWRKMYLCFYSDSRFSTQQNPMGQDREEKMNKLSWRRKHK
jgi:hypothetical protein